jgi:hypothetical protein
MNYPSHFIAGARRKAAEATIRQAADEWSAGNRELQPHVVLSVFLHALNANVGFPPFPQGHGSTAVGMSNPFGDLPLRPLETWKDKAQSPLDELRQLAPSVPETSAAECLSALSEIIEKASANWLLETRNSHRQSSSLGNSPDVLYDERYLPWWHSGYLRP